MMRIRQERVGITAQNDHEDFEDVMLLAEADRAQKEETLCVLSLDKAIEILRSLSAFCEE